MLRRTPAAGARVARARTVTLIVAERAAARSTVPDVVGPTRPTTRRGALERRPASRSTSRRTARSTDPSQDGRCSQ